MGSPPYYMRRKHTGELWVYFGTPLPNPKYIRITPNIVA